MTYAERLLQLQKRNEKIVKLRERGKTYEFIAQRYGISKQRVLDIVRRNKEIQEAVLSKGLDKI